MFASEEPGMLERAVVDCGNELELAIQELQQLHLEAATASRTTNHGNALDPEDVSMNGAERVDLFVKEMMAATSLEEAKSRASRLLDAFEKSIMSRSADKEKEQTMTLMKENLILKRAVVIQYKQSEKEKRELQELKDLVKALELKAYALSMHLTRAQANNDIDKIPHQPDVF